MESFDTELAARIRNDEHANTMIEYIVNFNKRDSRLIVSDPVAYSATDTEQE